MICPSTMRASFSLGKWDMSELATISTRFPFAAPAMALRDPDRCLHGNLPDHKRNDGNARQHGLNERELHLNGMLLLVRPGKGLDERGRAFEGFRQFGIDGGVAQRRPERVVTAQGGSIEGDVMAGTDEYHGVNRFSFDRLVGVGRGLARCTRSPRAEPISR